MDGILKIFLESEYEQNGFVSIITDGKTISFTTNAVLCDNCLDDLCLAKSPLVINGAVLKVRGTTFHIFGCILESTFENGFVLNYFDDNFVSNLLLDL